MTRRTWRGGGSHRLEKPGAMEGVTSQPWRDRGSHESTLARWRESRVNPGAIERVTNQPGAMEGVTSQPWRDRGSHESTLARWRESRVKPDGMEGVTSQTWWDGGSHESNLTQWRGQESTLARWMSGDKPVTMERTRLKTEY